MSDINFTAQAINAALLNNWKEAVKLNKDLLDKNPQDTEALNRLAYAHLQLGKLKEAKRFYKKVISIDNYNQIAKKNLLRLSSFKKANIELKTVSPLHPSFFLEEPGKTKTISLINIAPFSRLSQVTIGTEVFLHPKKHTVEIREKDKTYLGALPDDISYRLIRCLKAGNIYSVFIKNISKNQLTIFVKEISRGFKFRNQPSFIPQLSDYQASLHKEIISDEEDNDKEEAFS
ncbi:tetratricopeptide repeat protein [Candidatus Gottesmanbacteria bacterium]|nr:tetratricopeptide repeat protein [Candidatus Gottesmanbacteria bacterium]